MRRGTHSPKSMVSPSKQRFSGAPVGVGPDRADHRVWMRERSGSRARTSSAVGNWTAAQPGPLSIPVLSGLAQSLFGVFG